MVMSNKAKFTENSARFSGVDSELSRPRILGFLGCRVLAGPASPPARPASNLRVTSELSSLTMPVSSESFSHFLFYVSRHQPAGGRTPATSLTSSRALRVLSDPNPNPLHRTT